MPDIDWKFGPNALGYIHSTAQIVVLAGAPGTHKSFASIHAILAHQVRCGTSINIAIIRDTLTNITTSIVRSFNEYFQYAPRMVHFSNEDRKMTINLAGGFKIEADLFGVNDPGDLQRLQGASSWSLIWINDPAPMVGSSNAGVPEWAFNHAAYRAMRKSDLPGRLQIDMNYGEELHWTTRRLLEAPDFNPDYPLIRKEVFHTSYAEVQARNLEAEQMAGFIFTDEGDRARYVDGRPAEFKPGKTVAKTYKRADHLCTSIIHPHPALESFAFFDGWSNPACVLGQITKNNRLIYLDTVWLEGSDVATLLENQVGPLLHSPKWTDPETRQGKWRSWRIGGDFSMGIPDQGNIRHKTSDDVQNFFKQFDRGSNPRFEAGASKWKYLRESIIYWLRQNDPERQPMIYLSADNRFLDKGLNGGWHYKTDNSGNAVETEPVKDLYSHICDAWANSVYVLLGKEPRKINAWQYKDLNAKMRARANTYGVRGGSSREAAR